VKCCGEQAPLYCDWEGLESMKEAHELKCAKAAASNLIPYFEKKILLECRIADLEDV
jgi:hypothetical protein